MKDIISRSKVGARQSVENGKAIARLAAQLNTVVAKLDVVERQNRMLMRHLLMPKENMWQGLPLPIPDATPGAMVFDRSVLCRAQSFREPYFSFWAQELGQHLQYHRKLWEFVFVCQVLHERGLLDGGTRGLGFGVGTEPLSAYFASRGSQILGTDMSTDEAVAAGWSHTAQHAMGKQALGRPDLCDPEAFDRNVDFRTVDMNEVPEDLVDFDFCWSACALEHVGSIDKGLAFIERSLQTLKPGGIAVHTTEYNVSSNTETLTEGGTVLFRRQDMEALAQRLEAQGHQVAPFDFNPGYGHIDRYIDVAPYLSAPHLKLELAGYVTTSIGIIVRRGA